MIRGSFNNIQVSILKGGLLVAAVGILIFLFLPLNLDLLDDPYSVILEDKNGQLLSAQIANDGQWRFPIMDELPQNFIDCIITYEDKRFFYHWGIDLLAIGRAINQNLKANKILTGASTLPMQLIRMSRGKKTRTFKNKFIEMILAIKLEFKYSKKEILKMYASHAPFGGNVVGLETASWRYFNKKPDNLSLGQMATLAVLPNAPSLVRFDRNRATLIKKRDFLLDKLFKNGLISQMDLELSKSEKLEPKLFSLPRKAPHLLELIKKDGFSGRIKTTIDLGIQDQISHVLNQHYQALSQNEIHNASVLLLDTKSQEILAYHGNIPSTLHESSVDMVQAKRSSGSILKPLLYCSILDDGLMTPNYLVKDVPIYIDGFSPKNYNKSFNGAIDASEALSKSLNIPFVLLLQKYGVEKFRRKLYKAGLTSINKSGDHYGLSLILGGAEVRLSELTRTYAEMGQQLLEFHENSGKYSKKVIDDNPYLKSPIIEDDEVLVTPAYSYSAASIYHTFESMRQLSRPDDYGNWQSFFSSQNIAWKTGTSYGHKDAWTIGVTPNYTIGVWVGNADGEGRDEIIGVSTAGKILFDVLDLLPASNNWFVSPFDEMSLTQICHESGMLPSVHCLNRDTIMISNKSMNSDVCHYHITKWTDVDEQWIVDRNCYPSDQMKLRSYFVLPPLMGQYYSAVHSDYSAVPPKHPNCRNSAPIPLKMEWVYPNKNEQIYLPRDFNSDTQKMIAQISHQKQETTVYWYLNKKYLGETSEFHTMAIEQAPGTYTLKCIDQYGHDMSRNFEIVGNGQL